MSLHVLDTSVALAWYLPEAFSEEARYWQRRIMDGRARCMVPSLHYWETANVLRTYVRRGEMERGLAEEIYSIHLQAPLEVAEPPAEKLLSTALDYGATAYDAVYISLARSHNAPLLTAERTTTPWVVKLGKLARSVSK